LWALTSTGSEITGELSENAGSLLAFPLLLAPFDKSLDLVEVDRDDDFFPKSTDLIHFAGDFPIGA
jgi:hypothetical protein